MNTTYDDAMAAAYVRGRRLYPADIDAWMAAARPYLPGRRGRVLDLGAGTGRFTGALAQASGATVVACEPSAAMRRLCRASAPAEVPVVAGRAEEIPFADNTFDAVWASQVVHHVDDLKTLTSEVCRVLRPGGHLLLRGGFGRPDSPLFRYFPLAWELEVKTYHSLPLITGALARVGLARVTHLALPQRMAGDPNDLLKRVRTRSVSTLAKLPDAVFEQGLRALEKDVSDNRLAGHLTETLDLVVFRLS